MGKGAISMASRSVKGIRGAFSKATSGSESRWASFRSKIGDLIKKGAEKAGVGLKTAGSFAAEKAKDFGADFRAGYHAFMVSRDARHLDKLESRIREAQAFAGDKAAPAAEAVAAKAEAKAPEAAAPGVTAEAEAAAPAESARRTVSVRKVRLSEATGRHRDESVLRKGFTFSKAAEATAELSAETLDQMAEAARMYLCILYDKQGGESKMTHEELVQNTRGFTRYLNKLVDGPSADRLASIEGLPGTETAAAPDMEADLG